MTDLERLIDQLILHEALRLRLYIDSVGKATIGVGRNITDNGISKSEALVLLNNDIAEVITDLAGHFPWFVHLDPVRQRVVADMRFNLGPTRFRGFTNTISRIAAGDYQGAGNGMLKSKWATQVGTRAVRLYKMMVTGTDYTEIQA